MKKALRAAMLMALCMALLFTACGSGSNTPAQSAEQGSKETLPGKEDKTKEDNTKAAPDTKAAEITTEPEPTTPEETEPETMPPVYVGDLDPAAVYERVKVWDETLNQYTGLFSDKKVLLRQEKFDEKGEPDGHYRYAYDTLGNERVYAYYSDDGSLFGWGITEYDENGYMICKTTFNKEGKYRDKTVYTNDANGYEIKEEYFEKDETEPNNWDEYEVDAKGNRVKRYGYRKKALDFTYEYTYNDEGQIVHTRRYDAEGKLSFHWENVYDPAGHKIAENSYDPETDTLRDTAEANWSDDFHKRTNDWYSGGEKKGVDVYTFDDDGDQILFESFDNDGNLKSRTVWTYFKP